MSRDYYLKFDKEKIKLADKPFAGGGEGNLYKIIAPCEYRHYVAKIYHPKKRTQQREEKIRFLYQHPPEDTQQTKHPTHIWVRDLLHDAQHNFMGFIMPYVNGEKLEVLCYSKLPKRLSSQWKRFDLSNPNALKLRMRVCFNIATAIYHLHATQNYVLVDLKPENIIIQPNGLISIVDMDSVEVMENDRVRYPAPVATPEYTAPEHYTNQSRSHAEDAIDISWDLFALSVIFYKLLFGIHPFAGSAKPPYDKAVSLHEKIRYGLFVHHPDQHKLFQIIPPPHKGLFRLSDELQGLFIRCFVDGHDAPEERPLAEEWCIALLNSFGDEKMKAHFERLIARKGSVAGKRKRPSLLIEAPAPKSSLKHQLPPEINTLFDWTAPQLPFENSIKIKRAPIRMNSTATLTGSIVLVLLLFFLVMFLDPSLGSWLLNKFVEENVWKISLGICIALTIPILILPWIFTTVQYYINPVVKRWREIKKQVIQSSKHYHAHLNNFEQIRTKFKEEFNRLLPKKDQIEQKIKTKQEHFQKWLLTQDVLFEELLNEEVQEGKALFVNEYLPEIKQEIPLKNFQGTSFLEIEHYLRKQRRKDLQKIENPQQKSWVKVPNNQLQKRLDQIELKQEMFFDELEQEVRILSLKQQEDERALDRSIKKEGGIMNKYQEYFRHYAGNIGEIARNLVQAGLRSISQIVQINDLRAEVVIHGGFVIQLDEVTNSGSISLANKLETWWKDYKRIVAEGKDELKRIHNFYHNARNDIKRKRKEGIQKFEQMKAELQNRFSDTYKELLKEELYEQYSGYFKRLEVFENDYYAALKELDESYNAKFEELLAQAKIKAAEEQRALNKLIIDYKEETNKKIQLPELQELKKKGQLEIKEVVTASAKAVKAFNSLKK